MRTSYVWVKSLFYGFNPANVCNCLTQLFSSRTFMEPGHLGLYAYIRIYVGAHTVISAMEALKITNSWPKVSVI